MDIPVSRLNERMALQLPAELPLGLVFVVGQVQLPETAYEGRLGDFYLGDSDYRLPCRLSQRAAADVRLKPGDMVRAGGHLVFEPAWASYYLLARDVERLDGVRPAAKPLAAIIADSQRRDQASSLTPADLPTWVQQMAPPEIQSQQSTPVSGADLTEEAPRTPDDWELLADAQAAVAYPAAEPALAELSDELIAFLSLAMDSEQDVEITPELLSDLQATGSSDRLPPDLLNALDDVEASVRQSTPTPGTSRADLPYGDAIGGSTPDAPIDSAAPNQDDLALDPLADAQAEPAADEVDPELLALLAADLDMVAENDPVIVPEPVADPAPDQADKGLTPAREKPAVDHTVSQPGLIPWYVVVLVIFVFVLLVAAFLFLLLNPDIIPLQFSI